MEASQVPERLPPEVEEIIARLREVLHEQFAHSQQELNEYRQREPEAQEEIARLQQELSEYHQQDLDERNREVAGLQQKVNQLLMLLARLKAQQVTNEASDAAAAVEAQLPARQVAYYVNEAEGRESPVTDTAVAPEEVEETMKNAPVEETPPSFVPSVEQTTAVEKTTVAVAPPVEEITVPPPPPPPSSFVPGALPSVEETTAPPSFVQGPSPHVTETTAPADFVQSELPRGWIELFDDASATPYYHNEVENVTQWERPTSIPSADVPSDKGGDKGTTDKEPVTDKQVPSPVMNPDIVTQHILPVLCPNDLTALSETSQGLHGICQAFRAIQGFPVVVREEKLPTKMGYKYVQRQLVNAFGTYSKFLHEVYQIQSFRFLIRTSNHGMPYQVELKLWNHVWDKQNDSRTGTYCRPLETFPGPTEVSVVIRQEETGLLFERLDTLSGPIVRTVGDAISPSSFANLDDAKAYIALCGQRLPYFGENYPSPEYLVYRLDTDLDSQLTGNEPADRGAPIVEWEYRPAKDWAFQQDYHIGKNHNVLTQFDLDALPWYWKEDKLSWPLWGNLFFTASPNANIMLEAFVFRLDCPLSKMPCVTLTPRHFWLGPYPVMFRNIRFKDYIFMGDLSFKEDDLRFSEFSKVHYELTFDSGLVCILSVTVTGTRRENGDTIALGPEWGGVEDTGDICMFNKGLWSQVRAAVSVDDNDDQDLELATSRLLGRLKLEGATERLRSRMKDFIFQKSDPFSPSCYAIRCLEAQLDKMSHME